MSGELRSVLLLSGPNLSLLGERQPEVYGTATLDDHVRRACETGRRLGLRVEHLQSEDEACLVRAVHGARGRAEAVVVNAGALSHTSWSLHDALAAFGGVVVELHLSEPAGREEWRRTSVLAPVSDGTIAGFGGLGYELAVEAVHRLISQRADWAHSADSADSSGSGGDAVGGEDAGGEAGRSTA